MNESVRSPCSRPEDIIDILAKMAISLEIPLN